VFDHERRVGEELVSQIDDLFRVNSVGAMTQTSRNDIERAIRRAGRGNAGQPQTSALEAADVHSERMQRVSLDVFTEQIEGLTDDPAKAAEYRARAEAADTGPTAESVGARQAELVESIREKATEQLIEKVIAALETSGTTDERIDRALVQIDLVWEMTRDRADRIAAWESESMNTEFAAVYNLANGLFEYRWITRDDPIVRPLHEQRHLQVFSWDDPPDEEPYDGPPGVPPNCRCRAEPILA